MPVTKRLRLRFLGSNDRIVSFPINPPVEPVALSYVEELMDLIISSNTFYTYTGGSIVKKVDARLHTEELEPLAEFD